MLLSFTFNTFETLLSYRLTTSTSSIGATIEMIQEIFGRFASIIATTFIITCIHMSLQSLEFFAAG
jgi:hypothetical protein